MYLRFASVLLTAVLAGCFSGDQDGAIAQDCSTAKSALENARGELTAAQRKIVSSPQSARTELARIAQNLERAADGIENAELKGAVVAAADDLAKAFGGAGAPPAGFGSGLAKLDQTIQSKCSTG